MKDTVRVKFGKREIPVSGLQERDLTKLLNTFETDHTEMTELSKRHLKCQVKITTWSMNRLDDRNNVIEREVVARDIMLDEKIFGLKGSMGWKAVSKTLVMMVKAYLADWHSSMGKKVIVKEWPPGVWNDELTGQIGIHINLTDLEVLDEKIK